MPGYAYTVLKLPPEIAEKFAQVPEKVINHCNNRQHIQCDVA